MDATYVVVYTHRNANTRTPSSDSVFGSRPVATLLTQPRVSYKTFIVFVLHPDRIPSPSSASRWSADVRLFVFPVLNVFKRDQCKTFQQQTRVQSERPCTRYTKSNGNAQRAFEPSTKKKKSIYCFCRFMKTVCFSK